MKKIIKVVTISLMMLIVSINLNKTQAVVINGIDLGTMPTVGNQFSTYTKCFIAFDWNEDYYYVYSTISSDTTIKYDEEYGYYLDSKICQYHKIDKETKEFTTVDKFYFSSYQDMYDKCILCSNNINHGGLTRLFKNFDLEYNIPHNSRFRIYNSSNTIMHQQIPLTFNGSVKGNMLILDSNGNFREILILTTAMGSSFEISVPPQDYVTVYLTLDLLYQNKYIKHHVFRDKYATIEVDLPMQSLVGQQHYEIDGFDDITKEPYIMPLQAKALVLVKEEHPNIEDMFILKYYIVEKNEKLYFPKNKKTVFKFMHPENTTVLVESNFEIRSSVEDLPLVSKEIIDSLVEQVYGNPMPLEVAKNDTILSATPGSSVKINRLGLDSPKLINKMMDIFIETQVDTTGKIEWFGKDYNWIPKEDDPIIKKRQRDISNTMNNKRKRISIGQAEYVIITATTGSVNIRIPGEYKINEDFTIDIINDYSYMPEYENDFIASNPIISDLGEANDVYTRDYKPSMFDYIKEQLPTGQDGSGLTVPNISNIGQQITSFTDMFLIPIKNLFTAMPEIYSLIIFAFGVSIVMFVLGR